jgi:hypothetical protein
MWSFYRGGNQGAVGILDQRIRLMGILEENQVLRLSSDVGLSA